MSTVATNTGSPHNLPDSNRPAGLREFTGTLLRAITPRAVSNKCFFINDIPDLPIGTDRQMLATVFTGLMSAVVAHGRDACIRLTARLYGNVVLLHLRDVVCDTAAIEKEVLDLQPIAEKMMGTINVMNLRKNLTTVVFGFPNLPLLPE